MTAAEIQALEAAREDELAKLLRLDLAMLMIVRN